MRDPNPEAGEVSVSVGGQDLILVASIGGLARVSAHCQCKTLFELYERLIGSEPNAALAFIRNCTVAGDAEKALAAVGMKDLIGIGKSAGEAMAAHMDDASGNGEPEADS